MVHNANTACRGYRFFYVHALVQARRWASCYIAIGMCAFAHFLATRNGTQCEHRLSRLLFFFMSTHSCKHGGCVSLYRYRNVRFCALPCRSQWYSTRTPLVAVIVLFLCPHARASTAVGIKKNTLTSESVRVGRSYRNRTYTVGVRGPSATTTPSSIALIIIYQRMAI